MILFQVYRPMSLCCCFDIAIFDDFAHQATIIHSIWTKIHLLVWSSSNRQHCETTNKTLQTQLLSLSSVQSGGEWGVGDVMTQRTQPVIQPPPLPPLCLSPAPPYYTHNQLRPGLLEFTFNNHI